MSAPTELERRRFYRDAATWRVRLAVQDVDDRLRVGTPPADTPAAIDAAIAALTELRELVA